MMLVDSHCHLNFPDFKQDIEAVITRARENGVQVMQTICIEVEEFEEVLAIAEQHENIYCLIGAYPNESGDRKPGDCYCATAISTDRAGLNIKFSSGVFPQSD